MLGNDLGYQLRFEVAPRLRRLDNFIFKEVLPMFEKLYAKNRREARKSFEREMRKASKGPLEQGEYLDYEVHEEIIVGNNDLMEYLDGMTSSVEQSMRNLFAPGIFHFVEQSLADVAFKASVDKDPPENGLKDIARWYRTYLGVDIATFPSYQTIEELQLVANAVKHAEGNSVRKLRQARPDIFDDPFSGSLTEGELTKKDDRQYDRVSMPLAGADLFVTEKLLKHYSNASQLLFEEIGEYFYSHGNEEYPLDAPK